MLSIRYFYYLKILVSRVVFTMMSKKVGKKEITTFSEEGSFTEKRVVRARLGYITEFHRPEV